MGVDAGDVGGDAGCEDRPYARSEMERAFVARARGSPADRVWISIRSLAA